jgi:fucose 4-O-acetylase-like acetyltransferase
LGKTLRRRALADKQAGHKALKLHREKGMDKRHLPFIDNLRILLICLVIMVHLSVTYGGAGSWYYKEGQPDELSFALLTLHNATVQAFSMGLFFLIAGYFTPVSYDRKGPWRFLRDRLMCLGVPLLFYDFIINPLLAYPLIQVRAWEFNRSYREYLTMYYRSFHIGTGPLWFVEALLIFAFIYVFWRLLKNPVRNNLERCSISNGTKSSAAPSHRNQKFPGNKAIVLFSFALGFVSFVVRIWLPVGWTFEPLNLQFPFFTQYICLFFVGIIAYHRNWLTGIGSNIGKLWLSVAIVLILMLPLLFVVGGGLNGDIRPFGGGLHWQSLAYSLWEQSLSTAVIVALLVLFREKLNRQGKLTKAMSAGAYTAYIIHAPVIILLALSIKNVTLSPLLKFAVASLIAVPLCFALGNLLRKLPLARNIL